MADPFEQLWGPSPSANPGPLTLNLIKQFEGFAPVAKWDVRQYSGGYGSRAQPGERFTPALADQRLSQDVAPVNSWLDKNVTQPLTPERRAAFNSFGYNLGVDDLEKLKPDINRGDWSTVGNRMLSFNKALNKQTGQLEPLDALSKRRQQEAALVMGGQPPAPPQTETKPMPMPFQQPQQPGPLANAMGGSDISNSLVPGIFGGGDQPGYFGKLLADPTFLMGASVLGAGLSGRDAGTALTQGAQGANAAADLADRRRRAATWAKVMGGTTPDGTSPLLKGIPPEALPIIQSMGPEEGMKVLHQFALSKMAPHKIGSAAAGSGLYDEQTGQMLGQVPNESPYTKELGLAQAKADVKQGQSAVAGQQMLDLTDRMISLAGEPGSKERQTFSDATGPIQGTDWYQGIKGFVNSKAETPQAYRNLQQDLGTIKLLASRAYLSGEGQVSDNERRMVGDAVGNVESAPSGEAAVQAMQNLKQIVQQVFMKPKAGGQPGAVPAAAPGAPAPAPADIVMPGMAMQGAAPGGAPPQAPPPGALPPQAAPQPQPGPQGAPQGGGAAAPVTATGPNGEKVQLDPASGQWQPVQAPAAQPGGGAPAFSRSASPLWARGEDQAKLRANPSPELIQQYDAVFGPGSAAKVLMTPKAALGLGRGSYRMAP